MLNEITMDSLDHARIRIGKDFQQVDYKIDREVLRNSNNRVYGNRYVVYVDMPEPNDHTIFCRTFTAIERHIMYLLKITRDDLLSPDVWSQTHLVIKFKEVKNNG